MFQQFRGFPAKVSKLHACDQLHLVQQCSKNVSSDEEFTRLSHNIHVSIQVYDHTQNLHSHTSTPIPPMYSTLPTNGDMTSHISSPDSQYSTLSNRTSDKLTIKKTTGQYIEDKA